MTAHEYGQKFKGFPTFQRIAMDAFKAGQENAKPANIKELERQLKEARQELKSLWDTLHDPEKCSDLLAGM